MIGTVSHNHFINALKLAVNSFDWIADFLFPAVPNIFKNIEDFITSANNSGVVVHLRNWLGYLFYFIPWSFIKPFILAVISIILLRIVFALFRVITDLL